MILLTEYVAEVNKRVERLKESLARGSASDYAEYCKQCGQVLGLTQAITILKELVESKPAEERN